MKVIRRSNAQRGSDHRARSSRIASRRPPAAPLVRGLMSFFMRTVIQGVWDISQGSTETPTPVSTWTSGSMDDGWLFPEGWKKRLQYLFSEYRVKKIVAHYVPYAPITTFGEYVFALWDVGMHGFDINPLTLVGTPASTVRKQGEPSTLVWYPTEPDDKNWHPFGDFHKWCTASLASFESTYVTSEPHDSKKSSTTVQSAQIAGKVIVEVHVHLRGKSSNTCSVQSPSMCCCRKCLSRLNIAALVREHIQPTSPDEFFMISSPSGAPLH